MSIRVLVVDDSAFMRKVITQMINAEPDLTVVDTARNGEDALKKLATLAVDVVTLDVEMPVMDGLTALKGIMERHGLPVIMLSSLTKRSSQVTMKALSLGAIDFVAKPAGSISLRIEDVSEEITAKIRTAAKAKVQRLRPSSPPRSDTAAALGPMRPAAVSSGDVGLRKHGSSRVVVAVGSSTGGPKAVEEVLLHLPANLPAAVLVTQHMPAGFTRSFAERLHGVSPLNVKEAQDGDWLRDGCAFIAPGDYHMIVGPDKRIQLNQEPPLQFLRPAVDITMKSLPQIFGSKIVGVVLTGMGRDGAAGMAAIKACGGHTIAQDKATSTIYSMPRVVFENGHADYVLPIQRVAEGIIRLVNSLV